MPLSRRRTLYAPAGTLLLVSVTLIAHGWSLVSGTVLDDHWHQKGLREHGWSYAELLRTLEIEPADWMYIWWQDQPVRWEYGRPAFILAMKIVYHVLGSDNPVALHVFSVLLHLASVLMVWRLCWLLTRARIWSLLGGLLFAIYQHAIVTVAWSSSQNVVLSTTLMLAALLLYIHASGLELGPTPRAAEEPPPLRIGTFAGVLVLWLIGLFTKENSLMLAGLIVLFDGAFGGRRQLWARRWVYGSLAAIGVAFIVWRVLTVTHPMPDVYVRRPDGEWAAYLLWCTAKLLHYVCTSIWFAPMSVGPSGRFNPWTEAPGDCLLMLGIVGLLGGGYWAATRELRGWWLWPVWIVLAVLPVVPVIATPHSGYLPGVGFAVAVALAASRPLRARRRWFGHTLRGMAVFFLVGSGVFTMWNRWQWTGMIAAERLFNAWVVASPPPSDTTEVFVINLPFVNVYAQPALAQRLGPPLKDARFTALTFAPDPVLGPARCTVQRVGQRSLAVRIAGQPYFSRLMGRFLIDAFRSEGRFRSGQTIHADGFDVAIVESDGEGVRELAFTFDRPLDDPRYCFYLATENCGAARLRFRQWPPGPVPPPIAAEPYASVAEVQAALKLARRGSIESIDRLVATILAGKDAPAPAEAAPAEDSPAGRAARALHQPALGLATALGAPIQQTLLKPQMSRADWAAVARWRAAALDDQTLAELARGALVFAPYLKMREEVPHARMWAGTVIRTDLYLTGPPFPGPR